MHSRRFVCVLLFGLARCASDVASSDVPGADGDAQHGVDASAADIVDLTAADTPDVATLPDVVDVAPTLDATVLDSGFACGTMSCDLATQFCYELSAGYACWSWTDPCSTDHSCACLHTDLKCDASCSGDATTGVTVVCG